MYMKKTKVSSIILMEILEEEITKIIEDEIDKGEEHGDFVLVDLLIELSEILVIAVEMLRRDVD